MGLTRLSIQRPVFVIVLIISVIVVYQQIQYLQSKNLGYNKENLIHFDREVR